MVESSGQEGSRQEGSRQEDVLRTVPESFTPCTNDEANGWGMCILTRYETKSTSKIIHRYVTN